MTRRLTGCFLLLHLLVGCGGDSGGENIGQAGSPGHEAASATESAHLLRADPRIASLIFPCARDAHFGEDTSELIPALLQKLETGQKDPLLRAQISLSARGEDALPGLHLLTDRLLEAPEFHQRLHNVLGVVARMDPPLGRDLALRLVDVPGESLRLSALQALERRVKPEDYDRLMASLPQSSEVVAGVLVQILARADSNRLARDLARWIPSGELRNIWDSAGAGLQEFPPQAPVGDVLYSLLSQNLQTVGLPLRVRLLAISVRSASEANASAALQELTTRSVAEDPTERSLAFDGLRLADRADLLLPLILGEDDARLRQFAVASVMEWKPSRGEARIDEARTETLRRCLRDQDTEVRKVALTALVSDLDREAIDVAIQGLNGPREELENSIAALAPAAEKDKEIAAIIHETLAERLSRPEMNRDLRMVSQALGRLPLEAAANTLLSRARTQPGEVATLRAHRFLTLQIVNTGDAGIPLLRAALAETTDPVQRLDLLEALSASKSETATEELVSILQVGTELGGAAADFEALYVASRLISTRPATLVAPLLKRTALRMEAGEARRALQCLLWRYYGPEN